MASVIRGSDNFDSVYAKPKAQCTAWVNFDGTTTPPTIRDSYNVSSVVRTSTGIYDIYFETSMDNAYYSAVGNKQYAQAGDCVLDSYATNKVRCTTFNAGNTVANMSADVQIFGGKNS